MADNPSSRHRIYFSSFFVTFFYIPFVLITILYSFILFKLKAQKIPNGQSSKALEQRTRRHRNVLKMVIAIVVGFALCWGPMQIFFIRFLDAGASFSLSCTIQLYSSLAQFLAHLNCAVNPCICFIFSGNYRQGFKKICGGNL